MGAVVTGSRHTRVIARLLTAGEKAGQKGGCMPFNSAFIIIPRGRCLAFPVCRRGQKLKELVQGSRKKEAEAVNLRRSQGALSWPQVPTGALVEQASLICNSSDTPPTPINQWFATGSRS